ncbi:MAG: hybrid sensor histidine kinase/response regulator [Alphaproteobacteria bacterium]|nr:hybrid sensor histidine kinase/response regulator [Alphaproteobacteria bacterium]
MAPDNPFHNINHMSGLTAQYDWKLTPLGAIEKWPQSMRMLLGIMLGSHQPMFIAWGPQRIMFYNDSYASILGRKHPTALGQPMEKVWTEIWSDLEPIVNSTYAGQSIHMDDIELQMERHGHPEETHFSFSYTPVRGDGGEVLGLFCACTETTAKVFAERRIAAETERLRQMFQKAPGFITMLRGPTHIFEFVNDAYLQLVGHRDIVGLPVREALPEVEGQGFFELLDQVYNTGVVFTGHSLQVFLQRTPGSAPEESFLDLVYQPIKDGNDAVTGIFVEGYDVTERIRSEESMREMSQHLRLMVESAADYAIISTDNDGFISSWNSGAERIFGYTAQEAIGQCVSIIFTEEDREARTPTHEREIALKEGRATDERWHVRKNGERFYASGTTAAMYDDDKQIRGYIKISRDMTEMRRTQEALIDARNAAEAANIAKSEFLANMSHEIRTPMNAVIGLSNILAGSEPLTDAQRNFVRTLQMSADSLLALINDLLDISKIEARSIDLEHVPFSMTQIIQEIISMMGVRVHEKGLTFSGDGECVEHRMFMGDPTRLRQIILNLCSNAVKFTHQGGVHLSISCNPGDRPGVENICIAIKDTGIGIPKNKQADIFQKFVQADSSVNRKYGGTGLGLAITKTLTEIMGGTLTVESIEGQGSTFTVCVPLEIAGTVDIQEADYSLPKIFEPFAASAKKKILLVEDYAPNVLVATSFLENFGYDWDVASDGMQALEKLKTGRYDLILMDVQMPGLNGLDATGLLREYEKQHNRPRIPVIGMTAHAMAGYRERCLGAGMDEYIAKPFNPDELKTLIAEQLK